MKKIFTIVVTTLVLISCGNKPATRHTEWAYDATIYEMNTRQLTPEGTFAAAERLLPEMKECGIDIIWVMPCQPIGIKERKGTLGSYYSVRDYCAINPEFGTMDDFRHFLDAAHQQGMKVILDWVANHTAPDNAWTENPGWHMRDSLGNLMVQYDWTDIAKLDYSNADMRQAMKQAMHFWMDSIGIDGFRCDVAGEVPTEFWNEVMGELKATHPDMFTLAEDEAKAQELTETAFDMYYGWELHHLMNGVAQGKNTVEDLWNYFDRVDSTLNPQAIRMNFTSNHDENSWSGTEYERMGVASRTMAAFTYIVPGMPLIYTGQPSGNYHRLQFFEKDCIDRHDDAIQAQVYKELNGLRKANRALWSNEKGAKMERMETDNSNIFAAKRELKCKKYGDNIVIAILNMSAHEQVVKLNFGPLAGRFSTFGGEDVMIEPVQSFALQPWEYRIFTRIDK